MNTEELAVAETQMRFSWCDQLVPGFQTQDKVINTDGMIQIYESESRSKASHIGNVRGQIKGASWRKHFPDDVSYTATLVELEGYLNEGGVLLVKGLVNHQKREVALYYIALSPFKIMDFLKKAVGQGSTTLRLQKLPEEPGELVGIVLYCHAAQREDPSNHGVPAEIREGFSYQIVTPAEISFSAPVVLDREAGEIDFTVFRTDQDGVRAPIDASLEFVPRDYVLHPLDLRVASESVTYDNVSGRRLGVDSMRANLSDGLHLTLEQQEEELSASLTVEFGGSVAQFAKDALFFTECIDGGALWLNGHRMPFQGAAEFPDLRARLESISLLVEVFESLNIDASLVDLNNISEQLERDLRVVHRGVVRGLEIEPGVYSSGRFAIGVGSMRIELLMEVSEASGKWICHNPYSPNFEKQYYFLEDTGDGSNVVHLVTPYDVLSVEEVTQTLNLNLPNVVPSYEKLADANLARELASQFALNLITASDMTDSRRADLLAAAEKVLIWLGIEDPEKDPVHFVNVMQVRKRQGLIGGRDLGELRKLRRTMDGFGDDHSLEVAFCCSVLLGDFDDARERKGEMSAVRVEVIDAWPISALAIQGLA